MIPRASSNIMLLFKVLLISSAVLSAAFALKFYFPVISDFAVYELPSIYNDLVSWLRPPYLYLVLNCIIITIVASSKLQLDKDDVLPPPPTQPIHTLDAVTPQPDYPTGTMSDRSGYNVEVEKGSGFETHEVVDTLQDTRSEQTTFSAVDAVDGGVAFAEDATSHKEEEHVISKFMSTTTETKISTEYSSSNVKPPLSARLGNRRNVKSSPEGGKAALGVSKPKRNDTLESTWKTITEGRAVPLTRHLRKSDTWERDDTHFHGRLRQETKTMAKAETFQERRSQSPVMRKEASLSQEELNRRVEAFISKFNEEMRLQRQESLDQYREMINRGSNSHYA